MIRYQVTEIYWLLPPAVVDMDAVGPGAVNEFGQRHHVDVPPRLDHFLQQLAPAISHHSIGIPG